MYMGLSPKASVHGYYTRIAAPGAADLKPDSRVKHTPKVPILGRMRLYIALIALLVLTGAALADETGEFALDSNTAFYEGEALNYMVSSTSGFRLVIHKARFDGYSFAFVPDNEFYDSASTLVGVHIFKIRGMSFEDALTADTSAIREYYGPELALNPVPGIKNEDGDSLVTFYLDRKDQFIPNVMMAYFNGGTEMLIFELVISPEAVRFESEERFVAIVSRFRTLIRGELGSLY
jgi:hypothetical protein